MQKLYLILSFLFVHADMLVELLRREKAANIKPDPDVDIFMKVSSIALDILSIS